MDTPELAHSRSFETPLRAITAAAAAVVLLTAVGFLVGLLVPGLAGRTPPHPALAGSLNDAVSILASNLRVVAVPFALVLLGLARTHVGRVVGDLVLLVLAAVSTLTVGLELGRWQGRLIPYVPQLPIEWAALAIALATWLLACSDHTTSWRQLVPMAVLAAGLLVLAAGIETWCTPHRPHIQTASGPLVDMSRDPISAAGDVGCYRSGLCAAQGLVASRSQAPFPSLRSVPLSPSGGAAGLTTTTDPHLGGITR
jgi:hypothetical protein